MLLVDGKNKRKFLQKVKPCALEKYPCSLAKAVKLAQTYGKL